MDSRGKNSGEMPEFSADFLKISPDVLRVTFFKRLVWIIAAGILVFAISAACVKLQIKNKWTSTCILYRLPQSTELKKEIPSLYDAPDINTVIESVRTRSNVLRVIERLKLDISVDAFFGKTKIVKQKNNNLFTILAEDEDRARSAEIANELALAFLDSYAEMMRSSANKLNEQYRASAEGIRGEVARLEDVLRKILADNDIAAVDAEMNINFQKLSDIQIKLLESRAAAETAKIRIQDLKAAVSQMSSEEQISYVITPPEAGVMEELQKELNGLLQKFTEENPKVKRLQAEIAELKKRAEGAGRPKPEQVTYGSNKTKKDMEIEAMRAESDLKSAEKNIESYKEEMKATRKTLERISSVSEKYGQIKSQLDLNKQSLAKVEQMISLSELSVKPNSLDIKILEPAVPPPYPDSSKKKAIVMAATAVSLLLAALAALGAEVLDLTVKSGYDMGAVFRIADLGSLPDRERVNLSLFNTAFQVLFKNMESEVSGKKTPLVVLGGVEAGTGKSLIISECIRILKARGKKVLVIGRPEGDAPQESRINGVLYGNGDFGGFAPVLVDGAWRGYFDLDEDTFAYPLDEERLKAFIGSQASYDIIYWELFEYGRNVRLFAGICRQSDLFMLVTRFRKSRKLELLSCLKFLRKEQPPRMGGVLNRVDNDYFTLS